jgi:hypothetical protein
MAEHSTPRIEITLNGPYRVTGDVVIHDANGNIVSTHTNVCLCAAHATSRFAMPRMA